MARAKKARKRRHKPGRKRHVTLQDSVGVRSIRSIRRRLARAAGGSEKRLMKLLFPGA